MAFNDAPIQNTQVTTGVPQPTPTPVAAVPQPVPVVIDVELQKMLQMLGLTMEQWQAKSQQEQANLKVQYTQMQQQLASEQTGMGITGCCVEHNNVDDATPLSATKNSESLYSQNAEEKSTIISTEKPDKDPNKVAWWLKSSENKREYIKQQMINSGEFSDLSDEEIDQKLNTYIEYKTKQNLLEKESAPKLTNLSDEEWQNLSIEERAELIENSWNSLDNEKKERMKRKTINDYALMITNGLTQEEFNNLSKSELRILTIEENQKQLNLIEQRLNTLNAEHETSGHEHSETANNGCVTENEILKLESDKNALNREQTGIIAAQAKATTKDNNLHNTYCVIDEAMKLSGLDAKSFDRLEAEQKEEILSSYIKKQTSGLSEANKTAKITEIILNITNDKDITEKNKLYLTDLALKITDEDPIVIVKLLNDEQFINNFITQCQKVEELPLESYDALGNMILTTDRTINKNPDDIPAGLEEAEFVKAKRNYGRLLSSFANGNARMASIDDPTKVEMAKKGTRRIYENGSATAIETTSSTINASTQPGADILFGESAHIKDDTLRQEIYNDGIRGRNAETQIARNNYFISANPTSKGTYDTVNQGAKEGILHKDAQVEVAELVSTNAKEHLSEEESIQVHKDLYDAAAVGFDAENQDDTYKIVMNSGYTEVQEYAASNIYKLDESVRDWAEDYTKSLGIDSVTAAIQTEPPAPSENNTDSSYYMSYIDTDTQPITVSEANAVKTLVDDKGDIKLDLALQEDCDKLMELFEQYPVEMIKYLKIASMQNRESYVVALCNTSKSVAISLAEQDPSLGIMIITSSQIKSATQGAVASKMLDKYPKGSEAHTAALQYNNKYIAGSQPINNKPLHFKA